MREKDKPRAGHYRGEIRSRFNIVEQWDGQKWREPPEVGDYGEGRPGKIHFDVEDALRGDDDPADKAFRPRS
jgi:hypothetical protein